MVRLVGIAVVGIGLWLVCDASRAGDHGHTGYASPAVQAGYCPTAVHMASTRQPVHAASALNPVPFRSFNRQPNSGRHCHDGRVIVVYGYAGLIGGSPAAGFAAATDGWDPCDVAETRPRDRQANAVRSHWHQADHRPAKHVAAEGDNPAAKRPLQLSSEQFDRQTGKISWPQALQGDGLDAARRGLEQLASPGTPISGEAARNRIREIRKLTEEGKAQLKEKIRQVPPVDYIAAHKFLDALASELQAEGGKNDLLAQVQE